MSGISRDATTALMAYDFPGNVRELENLLERAYALGAKDVITRADLPSLTGHSALVAELTNASSKELPTMAQVERELILRAVERFRRNKERAARAIGLSRRTMYRRLREYGVL